MIPNQNWYAPSLTSNREAGLGNWDIKDIADLLQVGVSHRGTVYGPMAEVVYNSLQYLTDEDVKAMAVYLKALPQRDSEPPPTSQARLVDPAVMETRAQGLREAVRDVPRRRRQGLPAGVSAARRQPVDHHGVAGQPIRMVLNGGYPPGTRKNPRPHGMPPFSHILNDDEVAAVVTYIRVAWDNSGTPVQPRAGQRAAQAAARVKEPAMAEPIDRERQRSPTTARSTKSSAEGPSGAFAVAGVATAIVVAIYFVFYFFVYLPRGAVQ